MVLNSGLQVRLHVAPRPSWGAALICFTGSQTHYIRILRVAQERGLLLNERGLYRDGQLVAGVEEEDVYRELSLAWIPPELREDRGERGTE